MFIEVLWRGYTHWSMGIAGGLCLIIIYCLDAYFKHHILFSSLLSAFCVTFVELVSGIILNIILKMNVWDYSDMKFNFLGQISLVYFFLWYFLCIFAHFLCRIIKHRVFDVFQKANLQQMKKT